MSIESTTDDETTVWDVIEYGSVKGLDEIIKLNSVPLDATHTAGMSMLQTAVYHQKLDMVEYLLRRGANVDYQDVTGYTALTHAAVGGNVAIVKALIDANASVNVQDNQGMTALMDMIAMDDVNMTTVSFLLEQGADVTL